MMDMRNHHRLAVRHAQFVLLMAALFMAALLCSFVPQPPAAAAVDDSEQPAVAPSQTDVPGDRPIRGRLVNAEGRPVGGATVSVKMTRRGNLGQSGSDGVTPSAVSDEKGRFVLLAEEAVTSVGIAITATGYAGHDIEMTPGDGPERTIRVSRGATITATIVRDGVPCSGLKMGVRQLDRDNFGYYVYGVHAVTDADGRVRFDHLPGAGRYAIYSVASSRPQPSVIPTTFFKAPGEGVARDLGRLEAIEPRSLTGRFVFEAGATLPPDSPVFLLRPLVAESVQAKVAADGSFEFPGLPPEGYKLIFHASGLRIDPSRLVWQLVEQYYAGLPIFESLRDVVIPVAVGDPPDYIFMKSKPSGVRVDDQQQLVDQEGDPVPLPRTIHGTVVDRAGRAVAGAKVLSEIPGIFNFRGEPSTSTAADGRFELTALPDTPIVVRAYAPGVQPGVGSRTVDYMTITLVPPEEQEIRLVVDPSLERIMPDLDPPPGPTKQSWWPYALLISSLLLSLPEWLKMARRRWEKSSKTQAKTQAQTEGPRPMSKAIPPPETPRHGGRQ